MKAGYLNKSGILELTKLHETAMLAFESFIRRASEINMPFMLKGSYVTRQYFPDDISRIPADLDWVFTDHVDEPQRAEYIFTKWVTQVTELKTDDGVEFRSFSEDAFWRSMDYAMADDFPTVNTDILCWVNGVKFEFDMDISFNLEIPGDTTPIQYKPLQGPSFLVPYTAPLHLQVAWKIHQTLVRPRMKDLFDLMYLVQHKGFNREVLHSAFDALLRECIADQVTVNQIEDFLNYKLDKLFKATTINDAWAYWRHGDTEIEKTWYFARNDKAKYITNANRLPVNLDVFLNQFREHMMTAGFTTELFLEFPDEVAELKIEMTTPTVPLKNKRQNEKTVAPPPQNSTQAPKKGQLSLLSWLRKVWKGLD